jgi:hypothetical protein
MAPGGITGGRKRKERMMKQNILHDFFSYQKNKLGYIRYKIDLFHMGYVILGFTSTGLMTKTIQRFESKQAALDACDEFVKRGLTIWPVGGIVSAPQSPS